MSDKGLNELRKLKPSLNRAAPADKERISYGQKSYVYFIEAPALARVKIGISLNPSGRLNTIQSCGPVQLSLATLIYGGALLESALHTFFDKERLHCEWFVKSPRLSNMIEYCRDHFRAPKHDEWETLFPEDMELPRAANTLARIRTALAEFDGMNVPSIAC